MTDQSLDGPNRCENCRLWLKGNSFNTSSWGHKICAIKGNFTAPDFVCKDYSKRDSLRVSPRVSPSPDPVNHPPHYTSHPSGVECITVVRHMTFNVGNVIKYLWRAGLKEHEGGLAKQIEDHEKALWYLKDEIERLKAGSAS